jgi:AcrR family transcriptional regulator
MQEQGKGAPKSTIAVARAVERERIMAAAIELTAQVGYGELTVEKILSRTAVSRGQFYSHFAGVNDCFAAAYELEAERLCEVLLGAVSVARLWRERVRAALTALLGFAVERPQVAKCLLCEVSAGGTAPRRKRDEVVARLTAAIGRPEEDEISEAGLSPHPVGGMFVVGAVEGILRSRLATGKQQGLLEVVPELMFLIVTTFLGKVAALSELDRP